MKSATFQLLKGIDRFILTGNSEDVKEVFYNFRRGFVYFITLGGIVLA